MAILGRFIRCTTKVSVGTIGTTYSPCRSALYDIVNSHFGRCGLLNSNTHKHKLNSKPTKSKPKPIDRKSKRPKQPFKSNNTTSNKTISTYQTLKSELLSYDNVCYSPKLLIQILKMVRSKIYTKQI